MSKLQNNFTTPEQSKRLLALGVPAWTADCYTIINNDVYNKDEIRVRQNEYEINYSFFNNKHYNPCWSVGRLIEILNICSIHNIVSIYRTDRNVTQIDIVLETIINRINGNSIDFSKLEE